MSLISRISAGSERRVRALVDDRVQDLGRRVKAARARRAMQTVGDGVSRGRAGNGMAIGLRIVIEMVAGLAVGVVGGLYLDRHFGTAPFLLIVGFILGAGASFANVLRTARELDARQARERAAAEGDGGTGEG
jgi:ATP synthase protein I